MDVPFLDLKAQYLSIKDEVDEAVQAVLHSCAFTGGPFVEEFEKAFAEMHRAVHCVAVNSGTAALHAAFMVHGIGPGDEVIVPANTFFATPEAVSLCGAIPVFVDCSPGDFNMDTSRIESAVTERTAAIVPVHLYGQPADMNGILDIAAKYRLKVIEDCAQAHLAEYQGKSVGALGHCGCFSFYPGKNLGAYGEGGAVLTNDAHLAGSLRQFRDHGMARKYHHEFVGHNYRMTGLQGAILHVKLSHLEAWTQRRRAAAALYRRLLEHCVSVQLPRDKPDCRHVYHLFVIRTAARDDLAAYLKSKGVATGLHYPVPCHLQPAYDFLHHQAGDFPAAEQAACEILSLPMSEQLKDDEITYVCEMIRSFF
ncbi:DegT/DnrJ/EryC1/StrS family aminotransferase [bacterium]|nr:DegT/DnrJ/EryC1/StrS family aminotransferase [bacterium]